MEYERLAWLALLAATWVAVIVGMYLVVGRKHDAALLARKGRKSGQSKSKATISTTDSS